MINESGGPDFTRWILQRESRPLVAHVAGRQAPQLVVDNRDQLVDRMTVAVVRLEQQQGHLHPWVHWPSTAPAGGGCPIVSRTGRSWTFPLQKVPIATRACCRPLGSNGI